MLLCYVCTILTCDYHARTVRWTCGVSLRDSVECGAEGENIGIESVPAFDDVKRN